MSVPALNSQNTPGSSGAPLRPGSLRAWRVLTREKSLLTRRLFLPPWFALMARVPDPVSSASAVGGYLPLLRVLARGCLTVVNPSGWPDAPFGRGS